MLDDLCPPALIYLGFSFVQVIIDLIKADYNIAIIKFIMMIVFTTILNILCQTGFGVVAWIIVFIPFILMTIVTSLLLYVLGLSPHTGNIKYKSVEFNTNN